ncbi:FAD-binding oxidoreductase [Streptomyces sp. ID05-39B]|uniref:FAD-binding oxidoreductase n=1 Tax=Streptomyces sp. ID05-39B TaxID=3028664 RepID=UPI0029BA4028|nr:FAD-binding oxidoreductase [Streptomyces sp. ID05-39B]MDX3525235.1 FAD-binding oxidoreductase [Streptomyces sp. ID05-39B]
MIDPADELPYRTGQYLDIQVPGTDQWRSFSMAGLPAEGPGGRLEFIIRRYPGGLFSSFSSSGSRWQRVVTTASCRRCPARGCDGVPCRCRVPPVSVSDCAARSSAEARPASTPLALLLGSLQPLLSGLQSATFSQ